MTPPPDGMALEDVIEAFTDACQQGERPSIADWIERHPAWAADLRDLLPTIQLLESRDPPTHSEFLAASHPPSMPERIGDFRIQRELGRGGMGIVYEAVEEPLGRRVALKVLPALHLASTDARTRFQREAEVISRLDHPGICTVYRAGVEGNTPFISMRCIDGESLARRIENARSANLVPSSPPEIKEVLRVIESVARALHHAHSCGVVHRDVKPQNIMIDRDGRAVLLDFGLARDEAHAASLTRTGAVCGTPQYLPPEVLRGDPTPPSPAADVYSLGVVLFECLALEPPFAGPTLDSLYQAILHRDPIDVRARNRALGSDFQAVLACALEKDPLRRYRTAAHFAGDLHALSLDRPVSVKPPSFLGRGLRWTRREPVKASLAIGLIVISLALTGLAGYLAANLPKIEQARRVATHQRVEAALEAGYLNLSQKGASAAPHFRLALTEDPECVEALVGVALDQLYRLKPEEALSTLDSRRDLISAHPSVEYLRSTALRRLNRLAEANQVLDGIPAPSSSLDWFIRGVTDLDRGMSGQSAAFVQARDHLQRAVDTSHRARPFYLGALAQSAMYCRDRATADRVSAALLDLWPDRPSSWVWRAIAMQTMDPKIAHDAAAKAMESDPTLDTALQIRAEMNLSLGSPSNAAIWFAELVRRHPGVNWHAANLAHAEASESYRKGDLPRAELLWQKACELGRESGRNWMGLGQAQARLGKHSQAAAAFERALEIEPDSAYALGGLARVLLNTGDPGRAESLLRKAIDSEPGNANLRDNLAVALARQNRETEALRTLRESFQLDPQSPGTWENLRTLLVATGRFDERLRGAETRAARLPEDAQAQLELGIALLQTHRFADADRALERAILLSPGRAESRYHRAESWLQQGRWSEALLAFREGPSSATAGDSETLPWASRAERCESFLRLYDQFSDKNGDPELPDRAHQLLLILWLAVARGDPGLGQRVLLQVEQTLGEFTSREVSEYHELSATLGALTSQPGRAKDPESLAPARKSTLEDLGALLGDDRQPAGVPVPSPVRVRWARFQEDPRFAHLRDPAQLSLLTDAEQRRWKLLWEDVQRLLSAP